MKTEEKKPEPFLPPKGFDIPSDMEVVRTSYSHLIISRYLLWKTIIYSLKNLMKCLCVHSSGTAIKWDNLK